MRNEGKTLELAGGLHDILSQGMRVCRVRPGHLIYLEAVGWGELGGMTSVEFVPTLPAPDFRSLREHIEQHPGRQGRPKPNLRLV